jgi:hypothetical protein
MKKLFVPLAIAVFLISGCMYHGPLQSLDPVAADESSTLTVITEKSILSNGAGFIPVIDGIETYSLAGNQYISFYVTPENHTVVGKFNGISTKITDKSVIKIHPKLKETVYIYFVGNSGFPPYVTTTRIPEDQAKQLMQEAERVGP